MGINDETFRLLLDGQEVPIASTYTVKSGVFDVPCAFSMRLGHNGLTKGLLETYPEYTPFELMVGDVRTSKGEIDTVALAGSTGSELVFTGRDMLKWLTDYRLDADRTFSEKTFLQLTKIAMDEVGLGSGFLIATNNVANRKAITGQVKTIAPASEETATETGGDGTVEEKTVSKTLKAELGSTWWDFLKQQYRRAGLFLWATPSGAFVLSRPDGGQKPLYRIIRRRGGRPADVTVIGQPTFKRDATKRFSECRVYGRAGSGKDGRGRIFGSCVDDEMVAIINRTEEDRANGGKRKKVDVVHDKLVKTTAEANFLAKRRIAESRRNGFGLSYTVAGHMVTGITGGTLVWQPDTVAEVIDEELGIEQNMYIESCEYSRTPQTNTVLNLLRPSDMIFAEEDFDTIPKPKLPPPVRVGKTELFVWVKNPTQGNLPTAHWMGPDGTLRTATNDDVSHYGLGGGSSGRY
jgi:hypothetical protein